MCDTLRHRGPDDEGIWTEGTVGLGMRRLSIIDLEGGHQPLHNEDRSVHLVFNGEIYNFRELRRGLEERGHTFRSGSDGEVMAHLWEEEGLGFLQHLNGMFAVALFDSKAQRLVLARDHFGIKPLYYSADAEQVTFGSEIKALLASGRVERSLDRGALGEFLAWEYVPAPRTLFRTVRKLEPGSYLDIRLDPFSWNLGCWWSLPDELQARRGSVEGGGEPKTEGEWEEAVGAQVSRSVGRQLVSDVPLGAFLSGGVDSSLVVSGMTDPKTFSIGFDDPSYNELEWSKRVAQALGTQHQVEVIRPKALELFDHLMQFMDDPIGDFSIFPTFLVSRLARSQVKVALSGDGGDEIFGGYETYVAQEKARLWERLPRFLRHGLLEPALRKLPPRPQKKGLINKARRFGEGMGHNPALGHTRWRLFMNQGLSRALFLDPSPEAGEMEIEEHILRLREEGEGLDPVDLGLLVDLRSYLSDNCLVKVDRMSMACSLEVRVPLLDPDLVLLAFSMPSSLKVRGGSTKPLLKRVAAQRVPKESVFRPKEGFSIPIKHWLRHELREVVADYLEPAYLRDQGIFHSSVVERLVKEHMVGEENHSHILWGLVVFQHWYRSWK